MLERVWRSRDRRRPGLKARALPTLRQYRTGHYAEVLYAERSAQLRDCSEGVHGFS